MPIAARAVRQAARALPQCSAGALRHVEAMMAWLLPLQTPLYSRADGLATSAKRLPDTRSAMRRSWRRRVRTNSRPFKARDGLHRRWKILDPVAQHAATPCSPSSPDSDQLQVLSVGCCSRHGSSWWPIAVLPGADRAPGRPPPPERHRQRSGTLLPRFLGHSTHVT